VFVPALIIFNLLIRRYRAHILAWVRQTRLMQAFQATKIYEIYQSITGWRGGAA